MPRHNVVHGGNVARSRAADDFDTIRSRMEELRLERAQALAGQNLGYPVDGAASEDDNRKRERRLPRPVLLRKLVR
jgi:hypothetical protein